MKNKKTKEKVLLTASYSDTNFKINHTIENFDPKKLDQWDIDHIEKSNPSVLYNKIFLRPLNGTKNMIPKKTEKFLKFTHETISSRKSSLNLAGIPISKSSSTNIMLMKEKVKNENYHRTELMEISNQIIIKKIEKEKYQNILNELYSFLNDAKKEHDLQVDMLKEQIGSISNHFSNFQKSISDFLAASPPRPKRNSIILQGHTTIIPQGRSSKVISHAISEAKMKQIIKSKGRINSLEACIMSYHEKYKNLKEEYEALIDKCKENIDSIQNIEQYLKLVYKTLSKEQIEYYRSLLKEGNDTRKEGLIWIVKKLLELNDNLEYSMFPLFLSHEQIDFLISVSKKQIERTSLVLIMQVFRKKQQKVNEEENMKRLRRMSQFANEKGSMGSFIQEMFSKGVFSQKTINDFERIYSKHESLMKQSIERKLEAVQMERIVKGIKEKIFCELADKKYSERGTNEDNGINVLQILMKNTQQKEYFEDLLQIRNRLKEIDVELTSLYKDMFEKVNGQLNQKGKKNIIKDKGDRIFYHKIYAALFGTMLPL